jgi:hypothetical protein
MFCTRIFGVVKLVLLLGIVLVLVNTYTAPLSQEYSPVGLRLQNYSSYVRHTVTNKEAHKNSNFDNNGGFAVDILSVASLERHSNLVQQRTTFGSHPSVRNFFNATEHDDYDPLCHKELTVEQVMKVSSFCRHRPASLSPTMKYLRGMFARKQWLEKKSNMVGWLCAIQRPYAGLKKAYTYYHRSNERLPNYFIILDDDSYYNMESFMMNNKEADSTLLSVTAGCLVRQPGKFLIPGYCMNYVTTSYVSHAQYCLCVVTQCTKSISHFLLVGLGQYSVVPH